ncbi:MAG TPA: type II toxin-antitoxin system VapC family toxin [Nitrososphaera sp.]|nr:type II toxin-antitoxin system VapC family toxin [Nitrososphaera sp.]
MRVYVDTSALFALYENHPKTYLVQASVSGAKIVISRITLLEFRSTVYKAVRSGKLKVSQARALVDAFRRDINRYILEEVKVPFWQTAWELIENHGSTVNLRSLDALHLAAALKSGESQPISAFVTLDGGLTSAAKKCGFTVRP